MPRYKIEIEYKGTDFIGWQRQKMKPSVQEVVERALCKLSQAPSFIFGAGRTDAGVHAVGQVAHFDLQKAYDPKRIKAALNFYIRPHDVIVLNCTEVPDDFHARFDAKSRSYIYKILNSPNPSVIEKEFVWHINTELDIIRMQEAAEILVGKHDFSSFRSTHCQSKSAIKLIEEIRVSKQDLLITIFIKAPSFMHNQVRIITGCLVKVGKGIWSKDNVAEVLAARDRKLAAQTAPAAGLYLYKIEY